MKLVLHISNMVTRPGPHGDIIRPAIMDYLTGVGGHQSLANKVSESYFGLAWVDSDDATPFDEAGGDVNVKILSPVFSSVAEANTWLEGNAEQGLIDAGEGVLANMGWVDTQLHKRKAVARYLSRHHSLAQTIFRFMQSHPALLQLFRSNLDSTVVSVLSAPQRQQVREWIEARGLSTAWMNGNTTVRQVIQYVIENQTWPVLPLGHSTGVLNLGEE